MGCGGRRSWSSSGGLGPPNVPRWGRPLRGITANNGEFAPPLGGESAFTWRGVARPALPGMLTDESINAREDAALEGAAPGRRPGGESVRAAAVQLNSTNDVDRNLHTADRLVREAAGRG